MILSTQACGAREKILRHYSCHATAVTQMHALDAMDFCHLLEQEPALSLFYKHFRTWGCWQRLSRALTLNGARLVSMARMVGDGTDQSTLKEKLAALAAATDEAVELTPKDTASLLSLVSDATSSGFAGHRKRAAMAKLAELVRELRLGS